MSKDASDLIDLAALPDEPALLKQLLVDRETLLHRVREEAAQQIERLQAERQAAIDAAVKAAVAAILRRYYGPRSETFDPRQLLLFGQRIEALPLDEASVAEEAGEQLVTRRVKNRDQHGRQQLPECPSG
jgi:transposase